MIGRFAYASVPALMLALAALPTPAAAGPMALTDYRMLVGIAAPQFSPDGRQIAFLTVRSDFVNDRYEATLRVIPAVGGESRAIVVDIPDLEEPRWSPDGRMLAFLGTVQNGKSQIYTVPAAGGTPAQLSNAPNGVEQFAWSPDGDTVAYVTPDDSPISDQDRRTHQDLFIIEHDDYLADKPAVPSHIWLLSVKTGTSRQLTRGPTSVLEAAPPFGGRPSAPSWSADGRWIVYTRQADANDADSDRTTAVAVNVASGEEGALSTRDSYEYDPRFAPKGGEVAYLYLHGPGAVSDVDLFVGSPDGGAVRDVSADLDRNLLADFAWLPDGSGVVVMADDHIGSKLYVQPLRGQGHALNLGALNPLDLASAPDGALAVVADSASQAPELYLLRTPDSSPQQLTHFNSRFAAFTYPNSIEVQWHASDGQPDDGILTYPDGYHPGKRYPLIVFSHGGPEAASTADFDSGEIGPLRDLFAARGYLVFEPNYRGSDNLGNAHEHAIYRDPGSGPDNDVI